MPPDTSSENVLHWPGRRTVRVEKAPAWWSTDAARAELPPTLAAALDRLAGHLLSEGEFVQVEPSDEEPWSAGLPREDCERIVSALRGTIGRAADRGASPAHVRRLHASLDRELYALQTAGLRAQALGQRRLLEEVSHDIRSPLNSILFLADALGNDPKGNLSAVQRRQVGVLYTAAVSLVKLVNDLIDFAHLGEGDRIRVTEVSFSVESAIADVKRLVGPLVAHRGVRLRDEVVTEGLRKGDPQLLSRVLLNLVSNAIQAVGEGGEVVIRVDEIPSGDLRIEVTDDAVGTDVERLRRMIAPEVHENHWSGETRGWTHGLGLAISARLVRAAGGDLRVEHLPGEGTCFAAELPFRRL